ncbi:MAG: PspA/IM30 family protein [Planctomycetota bacterium]
MFKAIWRYFRAFGYLLTGKIDAARKVLDTNPHVIRATYDSVIRDKKQRVQQYKEAVATIVAQQEKKMDKIKQLTADIEKIERLKTGALAKAKQRVAQLQAEGASSETIQHDEDYKTCQTAFQDFSSTLTEKQDRIAELEVEVKDYDKRIADHKIQLQHLAREIDKIKVEAADAVADIITAKEEKDLADMLSGISEDGASAELARMRDLRREVKAEARISKEVAGTDTGAQEAEFLEYARSSATSSEFDELVGLADEKDRVAAPPEKESDKKTSLPE